MNVSQASVMKELINLNPDNFFVAISKKVGSEVKEQPGYASRSLNQDDYINLRAVMLGIVRACKVDPSSIVFYSPPKPQRNGNDGLVLARFAMSGLVRNETMDDSITLFCRLVTGSPKGNLPFTLILDECAFGTKEPA